MPCNMLKEKVALVRQIISSLQKMCLNQTEVFKDQKRYLIWQGYLLNAYYLIDKLGSKDEISGYLKISVQKGEIKDKSIWRLKEIKIKFKE